MTPLRVLVAGGGPTGMTAAIELRRAGADVRIVDRAPGLTTRSQALVVQARTLEQFERYGIADEAVERGKPLGGARLISDGKEIFHIVLDRIESRYPYVLFLPESETERILDARMQALGIVTERGVEITNLDLEGSNYVATLRLADGSTERVRADWIVGCDGAHSTIRERAGIAFEGAGVGLSFFLGDLEIEGPDKPQGELVIHLHDGNIVFFGPLTDRYTRLIVARREDQGRGVAADRRLTIADFQNAIDEAGVRVRVVSADWMTPFNVSDRQAERYRAGNVFLAGDASHIHSPVGGQGMNTGIQDAANLCWKLAAVARGSSDPGPLLDSYERERGAVGKTLLESTERGLRIASLANPLLVRLRDGVLPAFSHVPLVQRLIAGFISETTISYRSSPIVRDEGGDGTLCAGDRLPDLALARHARPSLLSGWTDGRHRAIAFADDGDDRDLERALPGASVVVVRPEQLDDDGRRALGHEPKTIVVRPDGYVGFRARPERSDDLRAYAKRDAIAS